MNDTFLMASTSSITMQILGKIVQRAPAVAAKHGVLCFLFVCNSVTLRGQCAVRCVAVYRPISTKGLLFQMHYIVRISVARWRHNFRKIASKIAKIPKIGVKVCAHHFV